MQAVALRQLFFIKKNKNFCRKIRQNMVDFVGLFLIDFTELFVKDK